jgi:hypothetical protein
VNKFIGLVLAFAVLASVDLVAVTPASEATAIPPLATRALTLADMPQGWHQSDLEGGKLYVAHCPMRKHPPAPDQTLTREFYATTDGVEQPNLTEILYYGPGAEADYAAAIEQRDNCVDYHYNAADTTFTGSQHSMTFPKLAAKSTAFSATDTNPHDFVWHTGTVVFVIGKVAGVVNMGSFGVVNRPLLMKFANEAIRRVQSVSV